MNVSSNSVGIFVVPLANTLRLDRTEISKDKSPTIPLRVSLSPSAVSLGNRGGEASYELHRQLMQGVKRLGSQASLPVHGFCQTSLIGTDSASCSLVENRERAPEHHALQRHTARYGVKLFKLVLCNYLP